MSNLIKETIHNIKKLDTISMQLAKNRQDSLLKPKNSLGKLEDITVRLAGIYKNHNLKNLKKAILVFGSDNDVFEEKVSKDNQSLTAWHFPNLTQKYSALGSICDYTNTKILAIDLGIKTDEKVKNVIDEKISYATKNMTKGTSMTKEQAEKSIEIGITYANNLIKDGYNMIFIGEMGIANTTPASAIISVISELSPDIITGRGSGIDDIFLKNKINTIKQAIKINKPNKDDFMDVLMKIGGYETGAMLGAILSCSSSNTPIVLDGVITYSAAMLAYKVNPITKDYMIVTHKTREKAGIFALDYLGFTPALDLNLCLGEGYGAVIFSQIIDSAIYSYNTMATFEETFDIRGKM